MSAVRRILVATALLLAPIAATASDAIELAKICQGTFDKQLAKFKEQYDESELYEYIDRHQCKSSSSGGNFAVEGVGEIGSKKSSRRCEDFNKERNEYSSRWRFEFEPVLAAQQNLLECIKVATGSEGFALGHTYIDRKNVNMNVDVGHDVRTTVVLTATGGFRCKEGKGFFALGGEITRTGPYVIRCTRGAPPGGKFQEDATLALKRPGGAEYKTTILSEENEEALALKAIVAETEWDKWNDPSNPDAKRSPHRAWSGTFLQDLKVRLKSETADPKVKADWDKYDFGYKVAGCRPGKQHPPEPEIAIMAKAKRCEGADFVEAKIILQRPPAKFCGHRVYDVTCVTLPEARPALVKRLEANQVPIAELRALANTASLSTSPAGTK